MHVLQHYKNLVTKNNSLPLWLTSAMKDILGSLLVFLLILQRKNVGGRKSSILNTNF